MVSTPPLRVRAVEHGDWLYDCHAARFARVEHGACAASGFVPLFLSQLFGVRTSDWRETLSAAARAADDPEASQRIERVASSMTKKPPAVAAEIALLAYPAMERFVVRDTGGHAPFALRERALHQGNVDLGDLEVRHDDGWRRVGDTGLLSSAEGRRLAIAWIRSLCGLESSPLPPELAFAPAPRSSAVASVEPGVYLTGHSSVLVRGRSHGMLFDPVFLSRVGRTDGAFTPSQLAPLADAIALTHAHFDHYHLPTLAAFAQTPIVAPHVPQATIVCEDVAQRLREYELDARVPRWGDRLELGTIALHVLPFVGEQFLTSEEHPEARNWGNCYLVEVDGVRVLILADCGFERDRSILDVIEEWVSIHGPVDVVLAQSIGLRTHFGGGDPDLQITALTCAHRAGEAFELLRPERRVTLAPEDLPRVAEVSGARTLIGYGQFVADRGEPAVAPVLHRRVKLAEVRR